MSAPTVYAAIHAVAAEFADNGIAKSHTNKVDGYDYRSIDNVLGRLAPLLTKHRLCILPRVVERQVNERVGEGGRLLIHVALRAKFTFVSVDDGSQHSVQSFGEALDESDKATAKAMSAAYKSVMLQTFCVPVAGLDDADASSQKIRPRTHCAEPVQGWRQWCDDIIDIIAVCESEHAIHIVQDRNRGLLTAIGREKPELYARLGTAFTARRELLTQRASAPNKRKRSPIGNAGDQSGNPAEREIERV